MSSKQKLLYGWCGEFGWEVMTVVPEVNFLQHSYDVTIFGYKGTEKMYSDMDVKYVSHDLVLRGAGYGKNFGSTQWQNLDLSRFSYDVLRIHYHPDSQKIKVDKVPKFIREDICPEKRRKICVHARKFESVKTGRNWHHNFDKSIYLLRDLGFEIVFVGLPGCSSFIEGVGTDARSEDMESTVRHIKESVMTFGPSSGPMVLSLWCGTPVFTWSCGDTRMFHTERGSLEWNPFKVKHYHPWSSNETDDNLRLYKTAAYKPTEQEISTGISFALKCEGLIQ
jgi:hypothetical protein